MRSHVYNVNAQLLEGCPRTRYVVIVGQSSNLSDRIMGVHTKKSLMASHSGKVSDDQILQAIEDHRAPAVGVTDLSDELPVTRQAIYSRLQNLEADGLVEKYKVSRDTVWYLTPAGRRYLGKGQSDQ